MRDLHRMVVGALRQNCYVAAGERGEAVVVDPGDEAPRIAAFLAERGLRPRALLLTHGHQDHVGAAAELAEAGAPIYMHSADAAVLRRANFYRVLNGEPRIAIPRVDCDLAGSAALRLGSLEVGVLHTPGHTPGSVCFQLGEHVLTGDTVFAGHVGRTDLPEGDPAALAASLALLAERCPTGATLHPGHGEPASPGEVLPNAAALPELR